MTKITSLSGSQEAALPTIRDEWLAAGLATGAADRDEAIAGVNAAYAAAGLEPPSIVVWLDSPLAGCIGTTMLQKVWGQVWDQVGGQVRDQVRGQVWGQVGGQVWGQVRDQVRDQVWDQVRDQVWDQVWGQVGGQVWGQVWGQVDRAVYGQHDAGWLSFYDYFGQVLGLECCARLAGHSRVARSAGWWWPMRGAVVLTERPTVLHRDPQTRLHCEDGPALLYPDGFGVWAWHGTRVPRDLIERTWSLKEIFAEPNSEVRRCAIEKIGWDSFVQDAGLRPVASAPDPGNEPYYLALYDLPEDAGDLFDAPARILLCTNGTVERDGTRRRFGLPVPAHHTDPVEAAAELYGLPAQLYRQMEVRR